MGRTLPNGRLLSVTMTASSQMLTLQHHLPKFQSLCKWDKDVRQSVCESLSWFTWTFSAGRKWQKANQLLNQWRASPAVSPCHVIISTNQNRLCERWVFSIWWVPAPSDDQVTASKAPVKPKSKTVAKKAPAAKKPAAPKKAPGD